MKETLDVVAVLVVLLAFAALILGGGFALAVAVKLALTNDVFRDVSLGVLGAYVVVWAFLRVSEGQ